MNKTAMQEMIDFLMENDEILMPRTRMILVGQAEKLLPLERQQILDAVVHGEDLLDYEKTQTSPQDYFNTVFKQDEIDEDMSDFNRPFEGFK